MTYIREHADPVVAELFAGEWQTREKQEMAKRLKDDRLLCAVSALLDSENGKLVLYELINATGVFASSFTGNSATYYLEGKRAVGLYLYQLLMTADPHALQKLVDFAREEQQRGKRNDE